MSGETLPSQCRILLVFVKVMLLKKLARQSLRLLVLGSTGLSRGLAYVSYASMGVLTSIVIANIFMRFIFRAPLFYAQDTAIASLMILVFALLAELFRNDGHLRVNVFQKRLGVSKVGTVSEIGLTGLTLVFMCLVSWFCMKLTIEAYYTKGAFPVVRDLPKWPLYAIMLLSLLSLNLCMFIRLLKVSGLKVVERIIKESNR